jgi:hypothetical protein
MRSVREPQKKLSTDAFSCEGADLELHLSALSLEVACAAVTPPPAFTAAAVRVLTFAMSAAGTHHLKT